MVVVVVVVVYWPSQLIAAPNVVVVIGEWRRVARKQGWSAMGAPSLLWQASNINHSIHAVKCLASPVTLRKSVVCFTLPLAFSEALDDLHTELAAQEREKTSGHHVATSRSCRRLSRKSCHVAPLWSRIARGSSDGRERVETCQRH
jgi:hypothetical protein